MWWWPAVTDPDSVVVLQEAWPDGWVTVGAVSDEATLRMDLWGNLYVRHNPNIVDELAPYRSGERAEE
jgi:hypothetical protein